MRTETTVAAAAPAAETRGTNLPRPLSVAMVAACPFPTRQGTQVVIRHLATMLARAGHEVHLITYGDGEYEEEFEFHHHRATRVHGGSRPQTGTPAALKPAADAAVLMAAARVSKAHACDLLHVHNVEGLGVGALLKLQLSIPLVYHSHTALGPELPTYFRQHMAQTFAHIVGDVIDRTLPRAADAVITFHQDHRAHHLAHGVREDRVFVIPPGIDPDEVRNPDPQRVAALRAELGSGPVLLYAGNPGAYQNLPLLWSAYGLVREQRPDVQLVVASSQSDEDFAPTFSSEHESIREHVVFRRFRDLGELRTVLAVADVALCPRALEVGAPIKVLNYMAAGIPMVAVSAGVKHLLGSDLGVVVDNTPEAFAQGCLRMLDERPNLTEAYGLAVERFRTQSQLDAYEQVYARVLGARL